MKKILSLCVLTLVAIILVACNTEVDDKTIRFGVSFYPAPQIAELIKEDLEKEGYTLDIREFTHYAAANPALKNNEIDANFIQHQYYLANYNSQENASLELIQPMYHSKYSLYSEVFSSVEDIADGETVYIANDGVNTARALLLLQEAGLITLKAGKTFDATVDDVVLNHKNLKIDATSTLTSTQDKFDETGRRLAVMYPTYTTKLTNFNAAENALFNQDLTDTFNQTYAISIAVRSIDKNSDKIKALISALTSDKVRTWINENYGTAAIPAF